MVQLWSVKPLVNPETHLTGNPEIIIVSPEGSEGGYYFADRLYGVISFAMMSSTAVINTQMAPTETI
jgi:hypothetical protein